MYKKEKKNKALIIVIVLIILIGIIGTIIFKVSKNDTSVTNEEQITLSSNQELVYVTIKKILGNEITVYTTDGNSEETTTWQIPVGTEVVTKLGTTTTFSRLANGDNLKMIIENSDSQSDIIKIWIVD